jgi:hypothetical protein
VSFDFERMAEDKRERRRNLASRPVVEKLRLLDCLREREVAIRGERSPETSPSANS